MNSFMAYLKNKLDLGKFVIVKTGTNKLVIFKCFSNFTKCIYVTIIENLIEIRIDKVFDLRYHAPYIERLIISKQTFNSIDDSINYIQKNIV